ELSWFGGGASLGLLTLELFKFGISPPNEITAQLLDARVLLAVLGNRRFHVQIIKGFAAALSFGQWYFNPMPLMALHLAMNRRTRPILGRNASPAFTGVFVCIAMLLGYYFVYLISPDNIELYIQSSLDRLLLQLWPIAVVTYSMIASTDIGPERAAGSSRTVKLRISAVLTIIIVTFLISRASAPRTTTSVR